MNLGYCCKAPSLPRAVHGAEGGGECRVAQTEQMGQVCSKVPFSRRCQPDVEPGVVSHCDICTTAMNTNVKLLHKMLANDFFFLSLLKLKKKKVQKYLSIGNILWDPGKLDENFLSLYYFAFFELLIIRSLT